MNAKDLKIAKKFEKLLNKGKRIVLVSEKQPLTRINLIILKAICDMKNKRGLIITIERPHHYITYLLGIHGISQRNLTYIDLASSKEKRVVFPFKLGMIKNVLIGGFLARDFIVMDDYDFVLVDNITSASFYLSKENFKKFVYYIMNLSEKRNFKIILPIREDYYKKLKFIGDLADLEINFEEVEKNE